jgi:hypothetical protein
LSLDYIPNTTITFGSMSLLNVSTTPSPTFYREDTLSIDIGDINRTFAIQQGAPHSTSGSSSTSAVPTLPQGACYRPQRHRSHLRQHFSKGLAINLDDIDCTFANTLARDSPSASATSTAPSPTLRQGPHHLTSVEPTLRQGLAFNLGDINRTFAIQQAARRRPRQCQHSGKGLTIDLGVIDRTSANTSARDSPSTLMTSTAPLPTLRQGAHL